MSLNTSSTAPSAGVQDRPDVLIGAGWREATGEPFEIVDPSTEQPIAKIRQGSVADMDAAVESARTAFDRGSWSTWTSEQRADGIAALVAGLDARVEALANIATSEGGVPTSLASSFASAGRHYLDYYAKLARTFEFRTDRERLQGGVSRILRQPAGVVAAITPWNGALPAAGLKLGPALAAGCTVVIKPPPETPLASYLLADVVAELVAEGTLPPGVVNVLAAGADASAALVADPRVDKISFTGSTIIGRQIYAAAAERIARVTLELGGKSAAIVLDDIALTDVLPTLVPGGCGSTGQACFALTRVLVSRKRYAEVAEGIAAAMAQFTVGDAHDPATTLGPLSIARQLPRVLGYIDVARHDGATVAYGGGRPVELDTGFFVEPTLLTGVEPGHRVAQEEVFGPVISLIAYDDVDDAVAIANNSIYGLSGSIYTSDPERGFEIASRVRTGTMSVNAAVFDMTVPFGGFKQSGIGREGGPEGLEDFTEAKVVHMPPSTS